MQFPWLSVHFLPHLMGKHVLVWSDNISPVSMPGQMTLESTSLMEAGTPGYEKECLAAPRP